MAIEARLYSENLDFALGGPHDILVDNDCGFNNLCTVPQQKHLVSMQNFSQKTDLDTFLDGNVDCNMTHQLETMEFSAQIEKQRMEIDRVISLQSERLRSALMEHRKQQNTLLLKKLEPKTLFLLNQREEQIANATNRTIELEDYLKRMEIENQTWQIVAQEKEAMAASLSSTIERLKESVNLTCNNAEDAESCCQNIDRHVPENGFQINSKKMICRCCNSRYSCVIILPCRHLCSCKDCESFLDSCPVCRMVKKASIEALF